MKNLFFLREYLFPYGCGACGEALLCPEDAYYGLCTPCRLSCESALISSRRCTICGKKLVSEKEICIDCRGKINNDSGAFNDYLNNIKLLFPYMDKYKKILSAYKFRRSIGLGNFFTRCLSIVMSKSDLYMENAAWVPVPPHPGKIKKQGWDQVEYLARLLEKDHKHSNINKLPVLRCLKRLSSRNQKELNRKERETNLKGKVFCVKKPPKKVIILDDVFTTGATLNACAKTLLEGGAEKVYGVCLFYD